MNENTEYIFGDYFLKGYITNIVELKNSDKFSCMVKWLNRDMVK